MKQILSKIAFRDFVISILSLFSGAVCLGINYIIFRGELPEQGEYFLMTLAQDQISWLSVTAGLLYSFFLGYTSKSNPILIGISMVTIFPLIL